MKKLHILSTVLLVTAFILAACGPAGTPIPTEVGAAPTEVSGEPVEIAFFVPWTEDVWYVAAIEGARDRAEELGVDLQVYDAGYDVATQVQQFDTAMAAQPDAIVLSSVDPAAMVPSVEAAHDAGIVVVDYDRPLWATNKLDALLILDTPGLGSMGCEAIVDYLTEAKGEPAGKVIRVFGDLADTWVTDISIGWDPCIAENPGIEVLSAMSGPWEPEEAAANVEQLLLTNDDVDAIFLDSDWLGSGITAYLESAGYGKVGEDNHIFYVGVGGMPQALEYIREGWMDITINNPVPDFAGTAVEVANMLVSGEPLPSEWVQEGADWSPATIYPSPQYGNPPFPDEGAYMGPVLNMENVEIGLADVEDPSLWGNIVAGEGETAEAQPTEEMPPVDIAFFVPWTEDVWYVAAIAGAQERADALGVNLQVYDAGYEVATQVQQFDTAMASEPDAIVLSSVDPSAMVPSVEAAHDAGIVVVDYDRPLWATDKLDALLILDTPGLGTIGCESIADHLTEKYGEPRGTVIRAFGDLADTWVTDISLGWDPCTEQYPQIDVLSAMSGPWEPEEAAANVEQLLLTNETVDAIFLDSDWLGSGITAYLESAGYGKVGQADHIYYVGVGGMPQALEYIREGWMDITINNPVPDFSATAVEIAYMLVNGEPLPAEWVQEGAAWSPATIYPTPEYGTPPFPDEGEYTGPVLNMQNVVVGPAEVDDPGLWGNIVSE